MTSACPKCGGTNVRLITPGYVECFTDVQMGWNEAPPAVTGAGFQRTPVFARCGHRFQVAAGATECCGVDSCGRDSIGRCQGSCGRRLCGRHGTASGSLLCASCLAERTQREVDSNREAMSAAAQLDTANLQRVRQDLTAATDPANILRSISIGDDRIPLDLYQRKWTAAASSGVLDAEFSLVRVRHKKSFSHGSWSELSRIPAWLAPGFYHAKGSDRSVEVWVDANGGCWRTGFWSNPSNPDDALVGGGNDAFHVIRQARDLRPQKRRGPGTGNQQAGLSRGPVTWHWQGASRVFALEDSDRNTSASAIIQVAGHIVVGAAGQ